MGAELIPFQDVQGMASAIARSGLFGMKTPEQALALMLVAQAEGQHPATVTQDYDIIQGKAARKTHSVLARFQQMGGVVEWHELTDSVADATFSHKSGGRLRMTWTIEQAKRANLTNKDNWKNYPRAMLRARCIAEGIRAIYPAALGGMLVSEEAQDLPAGEKDMGPAEVVTTAPAQKPQNVLPAYTEEQFESLFPKWRERIESGASASELVKFVSSKATLSDQQRAAIMALKPATPEPSEDVVDAEWTNAYDSMEAGE